MSRPINPRFHDRDQENDRIMAEAEHALRIAQLEFTDEDWAFLTELEEALADGYNQVKPHEPVWIVKG